MSNPIRSVHVNVEFYNEIIGKWLNLKQNLNDICVDDCENEHFWAIGCACRCLVNRLAGDALSSVGSCFRIKTTPIPLNSSFLRYIIKNDTSSCSIVMIEGKEIFNEGRVWPADRDDGYSYDVDSDGNEIKCQECDEFCQFLKTIKLIISKNKGMSENKVRFFVQIFER